MDFFNYYFHDFRVEFFRAVKALVGRNTKHREVSDSTAVVEQNLGKFPHYILTPEHLTVFFS